MLPGEKSLKIRLQGHLNGVICVLLWQFHRAVVGPLPHMAMVLTRKQVSFHTPFSSIIVIKFLNGNIQFKAKYKIPLFSESGTLPRHLGDMSHLFCTVLVWQKYLLILNALGQPSFTSQVQCSSSIPSQHDRITSCEESNLYPGNRSINISTSCLIK